MKVAAIDTPTLQTQDTVGSSTMKAIVQDKYGSADVLQLRDTEKPAIGEHDVLVRVRAAAINPADRFSLTVPLGNGSYLEPKPRISMKPGGSNQQES